MAPQYVTVTFGDEREYEITLHAAELASLDKEAARGWLAREFETLECSPSNPMGKILVLDMILNVAKYGGESRFANGSEWARQFAAAVAVILERPAVAVDVARFTVG
jgi:hypothetical protein